MKKVKGFLVVLGLMFVFCGCGAEKVNEQTNTNPVTVVKDELVSTSDKIAEEKANKEEVETSIEKKTEEIAEDKESIQIATGPEKESVIEEQEQDSNLFYVDGVVTQEDFVICIGNVLVHTGDTMNNLLEQLGAPDDFVQARSCLYDGDDKLYTYGGIVIYTYPSGEDDIVYLMEVTGTETLLSGIGIGSGREDVLAAYGEAYTEFGTMLAYDLSETASLSFQMENDKVTFIEIYQE